MIKPILLFLLIFLPISVFSQTETDMNGNTSTKNEQIQPIKPYSRLENLNSLDVVSQIPSPISFPNALAFDGTDLWITGQNEFNIYKISMLDGSILESIPINLLEPYGMTFDGTYFYIADGQTDVIQKIDTQGNIITTIPVPTPQPSQSHGLTFDGSAIWLNDQREPTQSSSYNDLTYVINPNGSVLNQYNTLGNLPTGLAFDGTNIWSLDNGLDELHKIDPNTYTIIETFNTPSSVPTGLTFDGQYLWLVDNGTDLIYQIDIGSLSNSEFQFDNFLKIYPNPTNHYIHLDIKSSYNKADISIYDSTGKLLEKMIFENQQLLKINVDHFQDGLYFININIDGKLYTDKIIKK